jgi:hypothetical protein
LQFILRFCPGCTSDINPIHRIIQTIPIKIHIPAREQNRVLRRPPPGFRVVVPIPEPHQPGVPVAQPAREAEGHGKGRVGVADEGMFPEMSMLICLTLFLGFRGRPTELATGSEAR